MKHNNSAYNNLQHSKQIIDYAFDYCSWTGVYCVQGFVNQIVLAGLSIQGKLSSTISLLKNLQSLTLAYNSFRATIPQAITSLSLLTILDLSNNKFSGFIPSGIEHLTNLVTFNLANNELGGTISSSFANIQSLNLLVLSNNKFVGQISYPLFLMSVNITIQVIGNMDIGCYQPCGTSKNSLESQLKQCLPTLTPTQSPTAFASPIMSNNQSINVELVIIISCCVGGGLMILMLWYYFYSRAKHIKKMKEKIEREAKIKETLLNLPIHSFLLYNIDNEKQLYNKICDRASVSGTPLRSLRRSLSLSNKSVSYFSLVSNNDEFLTHLITLLDTHETSLNELDFKGRSVIDILLEFYGNLLINDDVILLVLRKWFYILFRFYYLCIILVYQLS